MVTTEFVAREVIMKFYNIKNAGLSFILPTIRFHIAKRSASICIALLLLVIGKMSANKETIEAGLSLKKLLTAIEEETFGSGVS